MTIKKLTDFILIKYPRRTIFSKDNSYYRMKHKTKKKLLLLAVSLTEKILHASNTKTH